MTPRTTAIAGTMLTALATLTACGADDSSLSAADTAPPASSATGSMDPLSEGVHRMAVLVADGVEAPDVRIQMPRGFTDDDSSWYVVSHDGAEFLGLWMVDRVDADACLSGGKDAFDPGPSTPDLADALVAQKSTRASRPEPVTLAGHEGLYVELSGPADLGRCDRYPALWRTPAERPIYSGGQVDQLWVLDVDGQRVVVNAAYQTGRSSESDIERLHAIVDSLEFV